MAHEGDHDLHFAMRGAGSSFAIITEFLYRVRKYLLDKIIFVCSVNSSASNLEDDIVVVSTEETPGVPEATDATSMAVSML